MKFNGLENYYSVNWQFGQGQDYETFHLIECLMLQQLFDY